MSSIVLIYPPVVKPCEPPPGIARLKAALDVAAIPAWTIDANIEGQLWLLEQAAGLPLPDDVRGRRAISGVARNLSALRTAANYSGAAPGRYQRAVNELNHALDLATRQAAARVTLADFQDARLSPVRSADLLQAQAQPENNPFHDYFAGPLAERIAELRPTHIGLSVAFLSQALCAAALMGTLRRRFPDMTFILGGGLITSWLRGPTGGAPLRALTPHLMSGPGEDGLVRLLGGTPPQVRTHLTPEFSGLPLADYLAPGPIIPYNASTGCWWHKCSFCPERAEGGPYINTPARTAASQLRELVQRHAPALLHLTDNALPPALLRELTRTPPGAPWYGFSRTIPALADPDFCRALRASGCLMLKLGLESGHDDVLAHMRKGANTTLAIQALRALRQAGIGVYGYLLFGTPEETEEQAGQTLEFMAGQAANISFLNLAVFNMPLNAPEAPQHAKSLFYDGDLSLYADFRHPSGFDRPKVRRFLDREAKRHPDIAAILRRDPPTFTSNHAALFL